MYMYTHIERWWLSVLLLLMGREEDQRQEGILQEKWHLYNYIYSHSCPCDLCICQIIINFLRIYAFLRVWVEEKNLKTT